MMHEGDRINREIQKLERELETPIPDKRRSEIEQAISNLKNKRRSWERPH